MKVLFFYFFFIKNLHNLCVLFTWYFINLFYLNDKNYASPDFSCQLKTYLLLGLFLGAKKIGWSAIKWSCEYNKCKLRFNCMWDWLFSKIKEDNFWSVLSLTVQLTRKYFHLGCQTEYWEFRNELNLI